MESNINKQLRVLKANKKLERIKSFYIHIMAYCIVNTVLVIAWYFDTYLAEVFWNRTFFITSCLGGVAVLGHSIGMYSENLFISKNGRNASLKN